MYFGKYNLDCEKGEIKKPVAWPANANGVYRGLTNINYAMSESTNTVAVKVLYDVGVKNSFYFLRDTLGMNSLIESKYWVVAVLIIILVFGALLTCKKRINMIRLEEKRKKILKEGGNRIKWQ